MLESTPLSCWHAPSKKDRQDSVRSDSSRFRPQVLEPCLDWRFARAVPASDTNPLAGPERLRTTLWWQRPAKNGKGPRDAALKDNPRDAQKTYMFFGNVYHSLCTCARVSACESAFCQSSKLIDVLAGPEKGQRSTMLPKDITAVESSLPSPWFNQAGPAGAPTRSLCCAWLAALAFIPGNIPSGGSWACKNLERPPNDCLGWRSTIWASFLTSH